MVPFCVKVTAVCRIVPHTSFRAAVRAVPSADVIVNVSIVIRAISYDIFSAASRTTTRPAPGPSVRCN